MEDMRFKLPSRRGMQATKPVYMQGPVAMSQGGSAYGAREDEDLWDEGGCMEYGALTTHVCDNPWTADAVARFIAAR